MSTKVTTPVSTEAISLADAKAHLRVTTSDDDGYIDALITAARQACEHETNRSIGEQTVLLQLDGFPLSSSGASAPIELPRPPLLTVVSVQYVDEDGVLQTLSPTLYSVDDGQQPSWLLPAYGEDWPATRDEANAVRVEYTAGWTTGTVPKNVRQWMLMLIGSMYENRETELVGAGATATMGFAPRLLDSARVHAL